MHAALTFEFQKGTPTEHLMNAKNNSGFNTIDLFRVSFASSLCVLAMAKGAGGEEDHGPGNLSRSQIAAFCVEGLLEAAREDDGSFSVEGPQA